MLLFLFVIFDQPEQAYSYTNVSVSVNAFSPSKCNLRQAVMLFHTCTTFKQRSHQVFEQIMANGSASLPPWLALDTFRDHVLQEQSAGPASTANYHQSRGLIKVWLSSECSWGYAERGIGRGPTEDHTVSVRGRRCEIGLLAVINLWP